MNAEAAVDAGHDVVAADEVGIPPDALRDELRMLDVVGLAFDDARYQHFGFRHLDRFEHGPLMGMAGVRRLELNRMRLRLPQDVDDVLKRHVAVVGTGIVAPAQMHPDLSGRNVHERPVERLDVQFHPIAKTGEVEVLELRVAPHRQVGAVHLQRHAGGGDRLVLVPHRLGNREHVVLVGPVILVAEEERGHSGRRRRQERARRAVCLHGGLQPLGILARRLHVSHADRRIARGPSSPGRPRYPGTRSCCPCRQTRSAGP